MPTARIQVPKSLFGGFQLLSSASDESVREFELLLSDYAIVSNPEKRKSNVVDSITGTPQQDAIKILDALLPLYRLKLDLEYTSEELAQEVINELKESDSLELAINVAVLEKRLIDFLNIEAISVATKATYLSLEQDKIYHDARVLTDIRPVFFGGNDQTPVAATVVHTLKIRYSENDEIKSFFVALDGHDVEILMGVLEKAKLKYSGIKAVLDNSGITFSGTE